MPAQDHKRIEWLERAAEAVEIHIRVGGDGKSVEVAIGRIVVRGLTLRAALDAARKATTLRIVDKLAFDIWLGQPELAWAKRAWTALETRPSLPTAANSSRHTCHSRTGNQV